MRIVQSKLTSSNTETSVEVVHQSPDGSVQTNRDPVGGDDADERDDENECGVEPVDVLVHVTPGHGSFGDMDLGSGVLAASTERNIVLRAVKEGLSPLFRRHCCKSAVNDAKVDDWNQPENRILSNRCPAHENHNEWLLGVREEQVF